MLLEWIININKSKDLYKQSVLNNLLILIRAKQFEMSTMEYG